MSGVAKRSLVPVVVFLTLACLPAIANPLHAEETCSAATIGEPFVLPDGREYPGGKLTICPAGSYSPVAFFDEIRVDGKPVALFLSRRSTSIESRPASVLMLFQREADRRLHLLGYAVPDGAQAHLYGFLSFPRPA